MFINGDFSKIIDLNLNKTKYIEEEEIELVKVFSRFPDEKYNFMRNESLINMELSTLGNPIIQVSINGHKKKFWLDTGAQLSVVSSSVAEECNIQEIFDTCVTANADHTKFSVASKPAYIKTLEVGQLTIENHSLK